MEILNEDWEGEDVWYVDDPRVPPSIRDHGARFRNPARYVIAVDGDYLLYGAGKRPIWLQNSLLSGKFP